MFLLSLIQAIIQLVCRPTIKALPGGPYMMLVWILKRFVSMFVNASRCSEIEQKFFVFVEF